MARPRSTHCKRGHPRDPNVKSCVTCRRLREQWKYAADEQFRERKKAYQVKWRKDFFKANGYWASDLYERKPKREPHTCEVHTG